MAGLSARRDNERDASSLRPSGQPNVVRAPYMGGVRVLLHPRLLWRCERALRLARSVE